MDCADEREQACFIKWAHRLDVLALAPELDEMLHWMRCAKQDTAASANPVPSTIESTYRLCLC